MIKAANNNVWFFRDMINGRLDLRNVRGRCSCLSSSVHSLCDDVAPHGVSILDHRTFLISYHWYQTLLHIFNLPINVGMYTTLSESSETPSPPLSYPSEACTVTKPILLTNKKFYKCESVLQLQTGNVEPPVQWPARSPGSRYIYQSGEISSPFQLLNAALISFSLP